MQSGTLPHFCMAEYSVDKIALVHIQDRRVLVALNKGSDAWYLPGGHREPGETDVETLVWKVKEELSVDIIPDTIAYLNTYEAQVHGRPNGEPGPMSGSDDLLVLVNALQVDALTLSQQKTVQSLRAAVPAVGVAQTDLA